MGFLFHVSLRLSIRRAFPDALVPLANAILIWLNFRIWFGQPRINHLAWCVVEALVGGSVGGSVQLALSASSAIGFCPLIFFAGFYSLMAVFWRDPPLHGEN